MGASRERLVRQMLTESLLLALLGGTLGVALSWAGVDALARLVPTELTFLRAADIDMDVRVLFFTLGVTLLTGIVSGLLPALGTSSPDLRQGLGVASGATTADRSQNRLRHALVVVEVALSLVLLVGASLMMRSFLRLSKEPPGFDPTRLIAANLTLPAQRYQTREQRDDFFNRVKAILKTHPGVESVSVASGIPTEGGSVAFDARVEIDGRPSEPRDGALVLPFSRVDSNYFKTMRIPLLRGREFGAEDVVDGAPAIIVNEEMARRYWPNEEPVGSRLRFDPEARWGTVVGVAANVGARQAGSVLSRMEFYYAISQDKRRSGSQTLIVRTTSDPDPLIATVKTAIHTVDKDQPVYRIDSVDTRLGEALAEPRFYLQLIAGFAGLTLLLVSMGLYGVMAHTVARRTRDIGIRMALGARRNDVLGLVLKRGLALTCSGVCAGIAASLSLSRAIEVILFGAPGLDPQTAATVALLLTAVALTACWIPALRATRIDPLVALKHE
jgi:putative ABC transport system permease protein